MNYLCAACLSLGVTFFFNTWLKRADGSYLFLCVFYSSEGGGSLWKPKKCGHFRQKLQGCGDRIGGRSGVWRCYETSGKSRWRSRAGNHLQPSFLLSWLVTRCFTTRCLTLYCFQIQVDENGKIVDAKFKTFGCGSAIASSSLATEWVKGKSVSWYKTV